MTLALALELSMTGVARRFDQDGHAWMYRKNRAYIFVSTDISDGTGDEDDVMWAEMPVVLGANLGDWEPFQ